MPLLINEITGESISRFVSLEEKQNVIRTEQTLLDGSIYLQRIGEPNVSYIITVFVDRTGKKHLMSAEDKAEFLKVDVKQGVFWGRVAELSFSERLAGDWFKAKLRLIKDEVL